MRKVIFVLAVVLFAMNAGAQKVNFANKVKIADAKVSTIQKKGKAVQYVKLSSLSNGQNYLTLKSGNTLYVEVINKQIKSLTLAKSTGFQNGKLSIKTKVMQFSCSGGLCACRGDADCNDMFTTGVCGDAICIDDVCICVRN